MATEPKRKRPPPVLADHHFKVARQILGFVYDNPDHTQAIRHWSPDKERDIKFTTRLGTQSGIPCYKLESPVTRTSNDKSDIYQQNFHLWKDDLKAVLTALHGTRAAGL